MEMCHPGTSPFYITLIGNKGGGLWGGGIPAAYNIPAAYIFPCSLYISCYMFFFQLNGGRKAAAPHNFRPTISVNFC